jgi:segregation and condensation protein A
MMAPLEPQIYALPNFEGPLDLMWHLIQQEELDILNVPLVEIMRQYVHQSSAADLDRGAEFIALAAAFIWYKSRKLLPLESAEVEPVSEEPASPSEIIHHLLEYSRIKEAAKGLSQLEKQQNAYYFRGQDPAFDPKRPMGIEHLSLEDLNALFQQILAKTAPHRVLVRAEEWKVSDKIKLFREIFAKQKSISFITMFTTDQSREELIVTFLALLELMKMGEARVVREVQSERIYIERNKPF